MREIPITWSEMGKQNIQAEEVYLVQLIVEATNISILVQVSEVIVSLE